MHSHYLILFLMQKPYGNIRPGQFLWDNLHRVILSMVPKLIYRTVKKYGFLFMRFIEIRIFIQNQMSSIQKDLMTKLSKAGTRCLTYLLATDQEIALVMWNKFKHYCFYRKFFLIKNFDLICIMNVFLIFRSSFRRLSN